MLTVPPPRLPPILQRAEGVLKPTTRARLAQARHTRVLVSSAETAVITPYKHETHGLDFLVYLWAALQGRREHLQMFGAIAAKPLEFLKHYLGFELYVVHDPDADWQALEGVMAVVWSDDSVPRARFRMQFYAFPSYRHPVMTRQIAQGVLHHLFDVCLYENVWGITPASNTLALRFLWRLGFRQRTYRQWGTIDPETMALTDAVETWLTHGEWVRLEYARKQKQLQEQDVAQAQG